MADSNGAREFRSLLWERDLPEAFRPPSWPDVEANAQFRMKLLKLADERPEMRAKLKQLCAVSPYFLVQAFGTTNDPRRKPSVLPFVMYPFQVDLMYECLEAIFLGHDYFIEKCRDMGASWIVIVCVVYLWLYWPDSAVLLGSFKEERVDRKRGSLMKMADTFIRRLPPWLMPDSFNPERHRVFMSLRNPEGDSSIEGEATNPEFGRGDRKTVILFDELAYWGDKQQGMDTEAWEGTADVANCRIALSTPHGVNNQYYRLKERFDSGAMRGVTLDWTKHPRKAEGLTIGPDGLPTSPWLEDQKKRRSAEYLAQEVFIKYLGTGNPAFPQSMEALNALRKTLGDRIMEGTYSKAYRFVYEEKRDDRLHLKIGHRIAKVEPWDPGDRGLYRDMFLDQRAHGGTPGVLHVFEEPLRDWKNLYTISCDQSEGLSGGDFSTISVLRRPDTPGKRAVQVAVWRGAVDADILAEIFVWMQRKYNGAFMVPEGNPAGQAMIGYVRDIMGPSFSRNCYHSEVTGKDQVKKTDRLGYVVSRVTKPPIVAATALAIRNFEVEINCLQTCVELFNYERTESGSYQGRAPYHDDAAIAFMLGLSGSQSGQQPRPVENTQERKAERDKRQLKRKMGLGARDGICL